MRASKQLSGVLSSGRWRKYLVGGVGAVVVLVYLVSFMNLRGSLVEVVQGTRSYAKTTDSPAVAAANATAVKAKNDSSVEDSSDYEPDPETTETPSDNCHVERDYGMIPQIQSIARQFCTEPANGDVIPSTYTVYDSREADILSTKFQHLRLDMRRTKVYKPIKDISHDGAAHDPRFWYVPSVPKCSCATKQNEAHGQPRIWRDIFAKDAEKNYMVCGSWIMGMHEGGTQFHGSAEIKRFSDTNVILVSRRDDHNPFFQISATLNTWLMMKVIGWTTANTQLVYLDKGFPSPIDVLQEKVLAPNHQVIHGDALLRKVVHFDSALVAPFEFSGPMMRHLNDFEPCQRNALITDFRAHSLTTLGVSLEKKDPKTCTVTVITRRPYGGRSLQRIWRNEDEVMEAMRRDYNHNATENTGANLHEHGACTFQSIDFVQIPLEEQMRIMVESDVVIGMHGAGMVNVMWTRPETLVVEIFPRKKKRWGYRNLCQFVGCLWHEFRGGKDIKTTKAKKDYNSNDKEIPYEEWKAFFDPLFRETVQELKQRAQ